MNKVDAATPTTFKKPIGCLPPCDLGTYRLVPRTPSLDQILEQSRVPPGVPSAGTSLEAVVAAQAKQIETLATLLSAVDPQALARLEAEKEAELKALVADLRRIRAAKRGRAVDGESSRLLSATNHATIGAMPSTEIVAPLKKRRGPPSKGPMVDLQKYLGLASMEALAEELGEEAVNVRSWNHRKQVPERAQATIARLRSERREVKRNEKA